ncbi:sulfite oxidase-like oxidoreductase [Thermoleptolyngbya oregonensis NK1-22]|uniref:Sulfite oxidase-like oxidoreductase n=1 Tax=Thermoleptolyngbya oregonensis NK1-22 TaxID=2547457 RepID=A0AA96Y5A0_9CYAN|nr:sulfite oxidase-like oxidoreductase [Thermoleptolyngbya sp. M55_K2018_002]WOB43641.1 sulfite oxidase-like oxidoreductase [Thermoleptolyngbya oregonensis NK1-22]HIK39113.1 sulfite oxidase-like oxidoreductase [Thermoleptolyngbya sp. M55_K2018_002]
MLGKFFKPPAPEQRDRVPPGQHLASGFPVLTYGATPDISSDVWELKIWGLAEPLTLTYADLLSLPQTEFTADFHCVTTWSKLDVQWTGVKVTDLMQRVNLNPSATHVMQHSYGGYTTNLELADFLREENFLAHTLAGEPLPAPHGGPVRLVVPHLYAWKSAKWINGLEFLDHEELGFWERNGYHRRGEPWAEERYSD